MLACYKNDGAHYAAEWAASATYALGRLCIVQGTLYFGVSLARQLRKPGVAEYLHHRGRLGELQRTPSRRNLADHRITRQQACHIAVRGVSLVCQHRVARAENHRGDDLLAGLFLDLAVHVDAREDAEALGAQRLGDALDGMVEGVGDFALEIDGGHGRSPCVS